MISVVHNLFKCGMSLCGMEKVWVTRETLFLEVASLVGGRSLALVGGRSSIACFISASEK